MLDDLILKLGTFSTSVPTRVVPIKWTIIAGFLLMFLIVTVAIIKSNGRKCIKKQMIGVSFLAFLGGYILYSLLFVGNISSNRGYEPLHL